MPNGIGKHLPRQARPSPGTKSAAIFNLLTTSNAIPKEITSAVDCDKSLITNVMKRYGISPQITESFKKNRADILAGMQEKLLSAVNQNKIKKAPAGSLVLAACQLFDKERLERDLSTSNLASIHADIAALRKQEAVDKSESENVDKSKD